MWISSGHGRAAMRLPLGVRANRLGLVLGSALLLLTGGCDGDQPDAIDVAVIGTPQAPFVNGARLPLAAQLVRAATIEGLVSLDAQGQVIPALADRWIVTDDGASYIFRLRDGTWPDGTPLSGETVVPALRQALGAVAGTPLALDLADIEQVRAMADRVVEIRLARPVPDLLQLLAQPELGLTRKGRGLGPMRLLRDGATARLGASSVAKAGDQVDGAGPGLRPVRLQALSGAAATLAFAQGKAAIVLGGRFADLPLARAVAGLSQRSLRLDPAQGLFGLAVVAPTGPLATAEFREALAMALDREALGAALGVAGWSASAAIVPDAVMAATVSDAGGTDTGGPFAAATPGAAASAAASPVPTDPSAPPLAGALRGAGWTALPIGERQARGAARIARWVTRNGPVPRLRVSLPDGPGADALFVRLSADLGTIGLSLDRVREGAPADLRLIDAVARYARPVWFLNQLSCAARRSLCSPAADARLAQARAAADPAQRAALEGEAAALLAGANVFLPFGMPVRWSLVRADFAGFAVNPVAFHPLPMLARRPD